MEEWFNSILITFPFPDQARGSYNCQEQHAGNRETGARERTPFFNDRKNNVYRCVST